MRRASQKWIRKPESQLKNREASRRARDRAWGVTTAMPPGYEQLVLDVFGQRCAACGAADGLELDHHYPLEGGHALLHNAVPLCRSCNARKRKKPPKTFYGPWKLAEIEVLLWETRVEFERRFGDGSAA